MLFEYLIRCEDDLIFYFLIPKTINKSRIKYIKSLHFFDFIYTRQNASEAERFESHVVGGIRS